MMSRKTRSTHVWCLVPEENFFTRLKCSHHDRKISLFEAPKLILVEIAFGMGMKSKKSPPAYVLHLKIRLKHRAMFWFDSAGSYDVKEDSKHTCLVLGT